jgi:hypothetical protein
MIFLKFDVFSFVRNAGTRKQAFCLTFFIWSVTSEHFGLFTNKRSGNAGYMQEIAPTAALYP